eukprot:COSAG05_NODE_3830_length_1816_cov_1.322656_1_plen_53_part_00
MKTGNMRKHHNAWLGAELRGMLIHVCGQATATVLRRQRSFMLAVTRTTIKQR